MSTAEQLRSRIRSAQRLLQERRQVLEQENREIDEAHERQRLRRELDEVENTIGEVNEEISECQAYRRNVDDDVCGIFLGDARSAEAHRAKPGSIIGHAPARKSEEVSCSKGVDKGEYLWKIGGLSWLVGALKQTDDDHIEADETIGIGGKNFDFWYTPAGGRFGTLAVFIRSAPETGKVFIRYKIFVKQRGSHFVQWGKTGEVCPAGAEKFGPDVPGAGESQPPRQGIFGLSHEDLLNSEWVDNDVLTIKFELEVRPSLSIETSGMRSLEALVSVPPATISADYSCMFESSRGSDVAFIVAGETMKAHSQILSARSEVFDRLLNVGMSESISKEIVVEDCDSSIFKALLHFIYTDDLAFIEKMLKGEHSASIEDKENTYLGRLQGMLAASHRYQLSRLRLWCEQQVCDHITTDDVCSILCQAHLYDAKQLESACLNFMQQNRQQVVVTEKFGILSKEWPEVMLKINIAMAGVSQMTAATAMDAHRKAGKRKRDE